MPYGNKKRKVLDEDKYLADLEFIIARDFFPDSEAVNLNLKYYEALENQDFASMKEIQMKLNKINDTFKYNCHNKAQINVQDTNFPFKNPNIKEDRDLTLDLYLARNTSEDNDSFKNLQQKAIENQLKKFQSSIKAVKDYKELNKNKLTDSSNVKAIGYNKDSKDNFKGFDDVAVFNPVFFNPDSAPLSAEEHIALTNKKSTINYDYFKSSSFLEPPTKKRYPTSVKVNIPGKIGHDGKEVNLNGTPTINGYEVLPDSPHVNLDATPNLTWGELGGTPKELVESTPISKFFIPDLSITEKIAHELTAQISKKKRQQKEQTKKLSSHHSISNRLTGSRRAMFTPQGLQLLSRMTPSISSSNSVLSSTRSRMKSRVCNTPSVRSVTDTPQSKKSKKNVTDDLLDL